MAKLVLSREGSLVNQRFLDEEPVTVGRGAANDLVVDDDSVSDSHATISVVGHDYILESHHEAGLSVNGTLHTRRILQHGDVIELGAYSLKYVDSKASSQMDLERTMLIPGLRSVLDKGDKTQELAAPMPAPRASTTRFPSAQVEWIAGPHRGSVHALDRVIATFGTPHTGVMVITRRPHGYFVTQVEGGEQARVNGEEIGQETRTLATGDIIDIAGEKLRFMQL